VRLPSPGYFWRAKERRESDEDNREFAGLAEVRTAEKTMSAAFIY
jgi:hypothetical protein